MTFSMVTLDVICIEQTADQTTFFQERICCWRSRTTHKLTESAILGDERLRAEP